MHWYSSLSVGFEILTTLMNSVFDGKMVCLHFENPLSFRLLFSTCSQLALWVYVSLGWLCTYLFADAPLCTLFCFSLCILLLNWFWLYQFDVIFYLYTCVDPLSLTCTTCVDLSANALCGAFRQTLQHLTRLPLLLCMKLNWCKCVLCMCSILRHVQG